MVIIVFLTGETEKSLSGSNFDISKASPGAYGAQPEIIGPLTSVYAERMSLDIVQLNQQYKKLKQRQNQAHIILAGWYSICMFYEHVIYCILHILEGNWGLITIT